MWRNVELKFRVPALEPVRLAALAAGARPEGRLWQTDTYYRCASGRLKLRHTEGQDAQLIWYARADLADARPSDYLLVPVPDAVALHQALAQALGVRAVVVKERTLYLWRQVRIHLDQVVGLGSFVELEAVLLPDQPESVGRDWLADLVERLGLAACMPVAESYGELVASR
jgi:adenylate cyclase class IV